MTNKGYFFAAQQKQFVYMIIGKIVGSERAAGGNRILNIEGFRFENKRLEKGDFKVPSRAPEGKQSKYEYIVDKETAQRQAIRFFLGDILI